MEAEATAYAIMMLETARTKGLIDQIGGGGGADQQDANEMSMLNRGYEGTGE